MKPAELNKTMDRYITLRTKRLALDKQSAEIKAEEDMLRQVIKTEVMARLEPGTVVFAPKGLGIQAEIKMKDEPEIQDWDTVTKHIQSTGEFDLLQKRLTPTAVRARWEAGQDVPGVGHNLTYEVSITKVKGGK